MFPLSRNKWISKEVPNYRKHPLPNNPYECLYIPIKYSLPKPVTTTSLQGIGRRGCPQIPGHTTGWYHQDETNEGSPGHRAHPRRDKFVPTCLRESRHQVVALDPTPLGNWKAENMIERLWNNFGPSHHHTITSAQTSHHHSTLTPKHHHTILTIITNRQHHPQSGIPMNHYKSL